MLIRVSPTEIDSVKQAFSCVFNQCKLIPYPFTDGMNRKSLICPTMGYLLGEDQFQPLVKAALDSGDRCIFLSGVESLDLLAFDDPRSAHWRIDVNSGSAWYDYTHPPESEYYYSYENVLYSPAGSWGVYITNEAFGVVGGSTKFIDSFLQGYRNPEIDCEEFIRYFQNYNPTTEWLRPLVRNIFGDNPPCDIPNTFP